MSAPRTLLAIDPGKTGAIARFLAGGLSAFAPATAEALCEILAEAAAFDDVTPVVLIEKVGGVPGQSAHRSFTFGRGVGELAGVCLAFGIEPVEVPPQVWKGKLGLRRAEGMTQAQNKAQSLAMARALWPEASKGLARAKDDGRAEAALIGHYWLEEYCK